MSDERDKKVHVFIGMIGHVDHDKKTLAAVIEKILKQKDDKDFLDCPTVREKFTRKRNHENISTVGKSTNEEIRSTTKVALQNLMMTREYLESLKQIGIVKIRRDYLSITGIHEETESKKFHK